MLHCNLCLTREPDRHATTSWLTQPGPTGWAISTGAARPEISNIDSLNGRKIGVSRLGSGSYVMGFVLADQQGWLSQKPAGSSSSSSSSPYSDFVVLNTFENLRKAVNSGEADFFMWEHFTSKRYYDSGDIRKVGEIYTPWSSWKIVASTKLVRDGQLDLRLHNLFDKLDKGIQHFNNNHDEAVTYISTELDYSEEDAREWLRTVRFPARTEGVDLSVVEDTVATLRKAGVLTAGRGMEPSPMVARQRPGTAPPS